MPPKSTSKASAPKRSDDLGSKICSILVGSESDVICIQVNLNCTLNILMDFVKKTALSKVNIRIKQLSDLPIDDPQSTQASSTLKIMTDIVQKLNAENVTLELFDESGVSANCRDNISMNALESGIFPNKSYFLFVHVVNESGPSSPRPLYIRSEPIIAQGKKK